MDGISHALAALQELGGYFVFEGEGGEEFVVIRKRDFAIDDGYEPEKQLELPAAPARDDSADEVLERINREIAAYQTQAEEEAFDDLALEVSDEDAFRQTQNGVPEPKRVRFEPLKGDISPDLQE